MEEPLYDQNIAMNNIYKLLTGKYDDVEQALDDIIEKTDKNYIFYPFDPNNYTEEDINKVIKYFSDKDEFEKCIELMECCSIKTKT